MSRNQADGSPDVRREEAVARRLSDALGRLAPAAASAGECPDAEQIAAYWQRSLSTEEIAKCEVHFAGCSRCREILVVLGATYEESLTAQPMLVAGPIAAGAVTHVAASKRPRPRLWRSLWLVPALAATGALAVWFVLRTPWRPPAERNSPSLIAEAPKTEQLQQELNPSELPQSYTADKNPSANVGAAAAPSELKKAEQPSDAAGSTNAPAPAAAPNRLPGETLAAQSPPSANTLRAPNAAAVQSSQSESSSGAPPTASAQPTRPALSGSTGVAAAPAPGEPTTGLARPEARAADRAPAISGLLGSSPVSNVIVRPPHPLLDRIASLAKSSPSPEVSWRAGAGGRIERSSDGGRTWQMQQSPLAEDWLAGNAASDSVCWLVGRNGAIARTDDGEHWRQIPGPATASDTNGRQPDWASVSATDALTAIVTSASQMKYVTRDGGKTWQQQLP